MGCRRALNLKSRLAANLIYGGLICEFIDKLVCLDINILLSRWRFRRFDITREKLFGGFCPLLLHSLRVILSLVRMEQFVGVSACWNDHCGVCTSTIHTFIVHDIMRRVVLRIHVSIRILVLGFGLYYTWGCCEPLRSGACSSIWLL